MLLELNLQKPYHYLIGYVKSCDYQLYRSNFSSLVYYADG